MADQRYKLNNGVEIPALGLGTWQSAAGEVEKSVSYALSIGYKHIDAGKCPAVWQLGIIADTDSILLWQRKRGWRRAKASFCKWNKKGRHFCYHETMVYIQLQGPIRSRQELESAGT